MILARKNAFLFAAVTTSLCFGCGKEEEESEDDADVLTGTWSMTCGTSDTGENKSYDTLTKTFKSGTMTIGYVEFSDATCTTKTQTVAATATYTIGEAVTAPAGATAAESTVQTFSLTLHTAEDVADANGADGAAAVCGGGFVLNTAKTLTKEACASTDGYNTIYDTNFGVFKIDGNNLYEGDPGADGSATDGTTAAKRPTALETRASVKQ